MQVRNMFFQDGDRKIDFVLAWKVKVKKQQEAEEARMIFETNLRDEGLELEYDKVRQASIMSTPFVN